MARSGCCAAAMMLMIFAAGCKGDGPTTPTVAALPSTGEAFDVTGIVTADQGTPVADAVVTMAHSLGGRFHRASAVTDGSGGYAIGFTSSPWTNTNGRGAARAEVVAEGYDMYWRTVIATGPQLVENFRLQRIKRVAAGDSIVLSVTPDNGDCLGWLYGPCGRVRVAVAAGGNLTVEAVLTQESARLPQLEICCISGNEVYGNPVTLPVIAGTEVRVEVGQSAAGVTAGQTLIVKSTLRPF
jgi:hypothetical protein